MSVRLTIDHGEMETPPGASLFECAESMEVHVPTSCIKNGKCKECLVEVLEGMDALSPLEPEEEHLPAPFRLACRARITGEQGRVACKTLRRKAMRIAESGTGAFEPPAELDPAVTRADADSDVFVHGVSVGPVSGPLCGIAIDLGTTTVVVRLHDLEMGALLESGSFENPQRFGGSDVMARIHYDTTHKGRLLQRTLLGYLSRTIAAFSCSAESILEVVVAGNSTMRDIFFALDVESIGQRPYRSLTEHEFREGEREHTALVKRAKRFRLPVHPEALVYGLPLLSGHVGADAAAALLASDLLQAEGWTGLMDIGTNTEFMLGRRGELFVASCPAGPAFEGGLVACGMPGLDGAIESVRIDDDGQVHCEVIGGGAPEGICGSGLIDLLSELVRTGRMNELGRYTDESDRFVVNAEHHIFLSEEDISQLAQAKGANAAGVRIVLGQAGLQLEDIDTFYLAGGFAKHIDQNAAKRIGLIINLPDEKIVQLGNAAIEGASIALLSQVKRRQLEALAGEIVHVELESDEAFFDHFVEGCQYKPVTMEDPA